MYELGFKKIENQLKRFITNNMDVKNGYLHLQSPKIHFSEFQCGRNSCLEISQKFLSAGKSVVWGRDETPATSMTIKLCFN